MIATRASVGGILVLACLLCSVAGVRADEVRQPVAAGGFYPGTATSLRGKLREMLREAAPDVPGDLRERRPLVLIVPHAGYTYSGRTAAACYKLLEGRRKPERIVLLGPSHRLWLTGACSLPDFTHYATPLGEVSVDTDLRDRLALSDPFHTTRQAHENEHCLEVQLPFLQTIWPDTPPILPVVVGKLNHSDRARAADALAPLLTEDNLLIVSTDFTHYGRRFDYTPFEGTSGRDLREKIRELDMEGVRCIEALDAAGFLDFLAAKQPTICGAGGIALLLETLSGSKGVRPVFLEWTNSGRVAGSYATCVSYVAMALYADPENFAVGGAAANPGSRTGPAPELSRTEQETLLRLARDAARCRLEGAAPPSPPGQMTDALRGHYGAFVTLKRQGRLRGCLGQVTGTRPLWSLVCELAPLAALQDPRFAPLKREELEQVTIQISVLGGVERISGPEDIEIGRHGLIVQKGGRRGLLLPQVATEEGWSSRTFLRRTCRKADLPPDAWQEADTRLYRFTATVFGEQ